MINENKLDELLALYPILLDVPPRLRLALQYEADSLKASEGQLLFDLESPCVTLIMVLSGAIRVVKPSSTGREILLYRVRPGELCLMTLSSLLASTNYSARGVIEAGVTGVSISRRLFIEMVDGSQSFRLTILRLFSERVVQLTGLVEEVAFGRLDQRLATLLLGKGVSIQITHQMLANELGSTREVVSRILEGFEEQGLVALERGGIQLLDLGAIHRLARLGDFSHRHLGRS
jgi:CRP/FNR family transcriptional regulator, anaerobic regulatory protein